MWLSYRSVFITPQISSYHSEPNNAGKELKTLNTWCHLTNLSLGLSSCLNSPFLVCKAKRLGARKVLTVCSLLHFYQAPNSSNLLLRQNSYVQSAITHSSWWINEEGNFYNKYGYADRLSLSETVNIRIDQELLENTINHALHLTSYQNWGHFLQHVANAKHNEN